MSAVKFFLLGEAVSVFLLVAALGGVSSSFVVRFHVVTGDSTMNLGGFSIGSAE